MSSYLYLSTVYGSSQAASDASEASAGPGLPATRSPQEGPPLHLHPDPLLGSALDPQVHCGRHCFPCHGKILFCITIWPILVFERMYILNYLDTTKKLPVFSIYVHKTILIINYLIIV